MKTAEMLQKITRTLHTGTNTSETHLDVTKLAKVLAEMDERLARID